MVGECGGRTAVELCTRAPVDALAVGEPETSVASHGSLRGSHNTTRVALSCPQTGVPPTSRLHKRGQESPAAGADGRRGGSRGQVRGRAADAAAQRQGAPQGLERLAGPVGSPAAGASSWTHLAQKAELIYWRSTQPSWHSPGTALDPARAPAHAPSSSSCPSLQVVCHARPHAAARPSAQWPERNFERHCRFCHRPATPAGRCLQGAPCRAHVSPPPARPAVGRLTSRSACRARWPNQHAPPPHPCFVILHTTRGIHMYTKRQCYALQCSII
jgi:hypothetical protein